MEASRISAAILSQLNDHVEVRKYGHGHLATLPLGFYDNDLVTLFIEPYEDGVRVSDQGTSALRLQMADVDLDSPRVVEAWRRSVVTLGAQSLATEDAQVGAWGSREDLGRLIFMVAEAMLRIDQLRWLATDRQPVRFRDRVVSKLVDITRSAENVTPNAPLPQTSGRTRQVTAAVGSSSESRIYVQALSTNNREYAAEHCYYVFSHTAVPRERVLAVAAGNSDSWPRTLLNELGNVTDIAFFEEKNDVRTKLQNQLARLAQTTTKN